MSMRGSLVSEYLYCRGCFAEAQLLDLEEVHSEPRARVVVARPRGMSEWELWKTAIDALRKLRPCHPIRFAIIGEAKDRAAVLVVNEHGEVTNAKTWDPGYGAGVDGDDE